MSTKTTVVIDGKEYTVDIISGQVLDYRERSDTIVRGGGNAKRGVRIDSRVEITADIWLKEFPSGQELHGTYSKPIGARVGNVIHEIYLDDLCSKPILVGVYNSSTHSLTSMYDTSQRWEDFFFGNSILTKRNHTFFEVIIMVPIITAAVMSVIGILLVYVPLKAEKNAKARMKRFESELTEFILASIPNLVDNV